MLRRVERPTLGVMAVALAVAFGALPHAARAYSQEEDAEAQRQAVIDSYDRGYRAAKEEMARQQASAAATPATTAAPAAQAAAPHPPAAVAARPPTRILDIKEVYSDAGHVEKVQEVPVVATPLPEGPSPTARNTAAAPAISEAAARPTPAPPAGQDTDDADYVEATPPALPPRPPRPYTYAGGTPASSYPARATYVADQAPRYAAPPPPWVSQNAPPPPVVQRAYWSPQYGRWIPY